jgi:dynein heavy chain
MWSTSYKLIKLFRTPHLFGQLKIALKLKSKIESLRSNMKLIQVLSNPGLKPRHWNSINQIVGIDITPNEETCLNDVLPFASIIEKHIEKLIAIVHQGNKEFQLESSILKMKSRWQSIKFKFVEYKSTHLLILNSLDDILSLIEDHIVKTFAIKNSPLFNEFRIEVENWYNKLVNSNIVN